MGVVDRMSSRQISDFIETERAIQSGETITAHGEDFKTLERMNEAAKRAGPKAVLPPSSESVNPGMHPKIYKRDKPLHERLEKGE